MSCIPTLPGAEALAPTSREEVNQFLEDWLEAEVFAEHMRIKGLDMISWSPQSSAGLLGGFGVGAKGTPRPRVHSVDLAPDHVLLLHRRCFL